MSFADSGGTACERFERYLHSYVNNELSIETNHEVLRHLETCPACAAELQELTRLQGAVRTAVRKSVAPVSLRAGVLERLGSRPSLSGTWILLAAAIAVIGLAGLVLFRAKPSHSPTVDESYFASVLAKLDPMMRIGMTDHLRCAVPRKYPKQPPPPAEFAAAMGPYKALTSIVRAAVPARYQLEAAHRCTINGRQFVHLIFKDSNGLISVVLTKKWDGEWLAGDAAHPVTASADHFQLAGFESGDYMGWVISDLPVSENRQIASGVAPAVSQFLLTFRG
jgi:anti-sigma factor RsiW